MLDETIDLTSAPVPSLDVVLAPSSTIDTSAGLENCAIWPPELIKAKSQAAHWTDRYYDISHAKWIFTLELLD
jgi:hypothetical protein